MPTPRQEISLENLGTRRWTSTINKFTRLLSNGENIILFEDQSFQISRESNTTVSISPGICLKSDQLIQITESNFTLDFEDWEDYVDTEEVGNPLNSEGYYYVILEYTYQRSRPAPKAAYKIIRDISSYYTPYLENYIFLGTVKIINSSGNYIIENSSDSILPYDPIDLTIVRPVVTSNIFHIDCGEL